MIDLDALLDELAARVAGRLMEANGDSPQAEPEPWRLLDAEGAARVLGRSSRWIRARAREGVLPWIRLDAGARMFDPEDLRRFARERRIGGLEDER